MRRRSFLITTLVSLLAPRLAPARPAAPLPGAAANVTPACAPAPATAVSLASAPILAPAPQPTVPPAILAAAPASTPAPGPTAATASVAAEAPPTVAEATTTPAPLAILLQQSPLAGFQYHQGPQLWSQLQAGQTLRLTREPANPYDPRAVRIDWNGAKLGYLPRLDNAAASQLLDRGERLTAYIAGLAEDRDPWQRIAVEVYLTPAKQTDLPRNA